MSRDWYYDPPEVDIHCSICGGGEDSCTCPECTVCQVHGDPDCINTHMPWRKWPHFGVAGAGLLMLIPDEDIPDPEPDLMEES